MTSYTQAPYLLRSRPYTAETYQRRDEHRAQTDNKNEDSYILTLHTDAEHQKLMTTLREKYFPRKLYKVDAHIALFRSLPGSELPRITEDIANVTASTASFTIESKELFRMRQGVGVNVSEERGQATSIYEKLKAQWKPFLTRQDRRFKAHYTIQNKVDDDMIVDRTLQELQEQFNGSQGRVLGLMLHKYDRGFWRMERYFVFGG